MIKFKEIKLIFLSILATSIAVSCNEPIINQQNNESQYINQKYKEHSLFDLKSNVLTKNTINAFFKRKFPSKTKTIIESFLDKMPFGDYSDNEKNKKLYRMFINYCIYNVDKEFYLDNKSENQNYNHKFLMNTPYYFDVSSNLEYKDLNIVQQIDSILNKSTLGYGNLPKLLKYSLYSFLNYYFKNETFDTDIEKRSQFVLENTNKPIEANFKKLYSFLDKTLKKSKSLLDVKNNEFEISDIKIKEIKNIKKVYLEFKSNKKLNKENFVIKVKSDKWKNDNQEYVFNNINIIYKEKLDNYTNFMNYNLDKEDDKSVWNIDITELLDNNSKSKEVFYVSGMDYKKIEYGMDYLNYFNKENISRYFDFIKRFKDFNQNKILITPQSFNITEFDWINGNLKNIIKDDGKLGLDKSSIFVPDK
ncbi:hypothetical protein [Mycoplasma leonicaptivi]|uniref:hypothetical protein n=1 Tax=Mycoplasma leonicaptivi TaxID=36742 RepID=UPI000488917D|nr:hypothetical protein [Mycoplasma leonicaptivi]